MPSDYDKIKENNILEYGQGTRHLSFLRTLYTDRTHFIFELLQNAEDARASRILFSLFDDRLEVNHDGRPFNERDVRGVCGIGEGTKAEDLTQIGKFGIGFKSVYAYTSTPEVHSGDESFRIENYVRPHPVAARRFGDSWTTLFVFAFNADDIDTETACREIGARLRSLSARTLLFLRKINEIEYKLPDLASGIYLHEEIARGSARQVTTIEQNNGQSVDENWLIFERPVPVPDGSCKVHVEVGFRLETGTKDKTETIIGIKDAPLVVYFPTEKITRFGFLIHGPYKTTPSRDNIPKDDDWNKTLVAETSALVNDALRDLKDMGLLSVHLLESMPIRMEDFEENSMFYPIVSRVREALMNEELLPADDGTFVAARNAKLARSTELRKLLDQNQLRALFQSNDEIKWLVGTITQDRTPDLRTYLLNELDVEEITPDGFARRVSSTFLEERSDDWMVLMYGFVGIQKALWKPQHGYWNPAGPLRAKPFIRLQDGSHVSPFRDDGSPNAYLTVGTSIRTSLPIVKVELSRHKEAYQFLNDLGIPELDLVAEVIEKILPKYRTASLTVSTDEHKRDFITIEHACATDSQEKKERLWEQLRATPFILAESPGTEGTIYGRPDQVYFGSDELRMYFSGNDSFACVSPDYAQSATVLFKDLGVKESVRIQRKGSNRQKYVTIKYYHGWHERGINGFDPDMHVDGLERAIATPIPERSAFIWNNIAVPNFACIRGGVETSTRQTYENSTLEDRISEFGRLLVDTAWLPRSDGSMHKPSDLTLDDLPESFVHDEKLAHQLGMKMDVVAKLAEEAGVTAENIEFLANHPEEFKQWKDSISAQQYKPTFPEKESSNLERRRENITKQLAAAPNKTYDQRARNIRITRGTVDPSLWLKNQYTNDSGQMICQVCKEEMPFRKRDGEHYFETVEALSRDHFSLEHEAQFLALCPVCAAMYKEFIKQDESAMTDLKNALMDADDFEVPLRLGELDTTVRFVETHYHDIKTILEEQK